MEQKSTESSIPGGLERWALLIGINYYFDGTDRQVNIKPLRGCVPDAEAVEQYLKAINVPEGHITKLTATEGPHGIMEPEFAWPTRNNIIDTLDKILERAKHGALVYIHYSGHGILRQKLRVDPDEGGNRFTGVALVPTDVKRGGAYLSAYQLGANIKSMVEQKQLRVTLVLDCCHSGRGIRGEDSDSDDGSENNARPDMLSGYRSVRGIEEADESMLASDEAADEQADNENGDHRGMDIARPSWLEDPHSCTVLTACGVMERAREVLFKSSAGPHGVLTYWLLRALYRDRDRPPSCSDIRGQVERKIATSLGKRIQTPGIFGDVYHEFFGLHTLPWTHSTRVIKKKREYILEAGSAQGVAVGATYELRPEDWDRSHNKVLDATISGTQHRLLIYVSEVFDLRSKVKPVQEQDRDEMDCLIDLGHRAVLDKWALPSRTVIKVVSALPTSEAAYLDRFRTLLQDELSTTHNLLLDVPGTIAEEDLRLAVDQQKAVEIQNGQGRPLPWLPRIPIPHSGAIERLADLLRQVARFQAVKELRYGKPHPKNRLEPSSFNFVAYDGNNRVLLPKTPAGVFIARKNQRIQVEFTVEEGSEPVYVTIFHLTDQFGVMKRIPKRGELPWELCKNDTNLPRFRGKMTIPAGREHNLAAVKEIIRAYVYRGSRLPSWNELQLPDLQTRDVAEGHDDSKNVRGMKDEEAFKEDGQWAVLDCSIVVLP